ncbi:MAG: hypothetical protein KZQ83_15075 [gamma proteobacterium symbiont of Taylorina sp.]|nr:hypothetical protein [gamma proteobacterium symbiont of Taylorina sp.]
MAFMTVPDGYEKTSLSDLQGAWGCLIDAVVDLYALNEGNKSFIHSRYSVGANLLEPYKEIISGALYPDIMRNYTLYNKIKLLVQDWMFYLKNHQPLIIIYSIVA